MAKLYVTTSEVAQAGRSASNTHGNTFVFEGASEMSDAQIKAVTDGYATLARGALMSGLQIYSVRTSPLPAPGQVTVDRNKHYTFKPKDFIGLNAPANGRQMADLEICAQIVKGATRGVVGRALLRGFMDEDEVNTDEAGLLLDPSADVLNRLNAYAGGLIANFKKGGGRGLILPGPKRLATGEYVAEAAYITSAREVTSVSVERLTRRQLEVSRQSIDAQRLDLLRTEINRLQRLYNEAKRAANGGALAEGDTDRLKIMGEDIYERYDASERLRVKVPAVLRTYIAEVK